MLEKKLLGAFTVSAAVLTLAGCGTTGTGGGGSGGGSTPVAAYAEEVGTANQALNAGYTLYSDTSVNTAAGRVARCGSGPCSSVPATATFALVQNSQGGIDVTINGETTSYSGSDYNGSTWTYEEDDGSYVLAGEVDAAGIGGDYHQGWAFNSANAATDTTLVGVAVLGAETTDSVVANKANATYSGTARITGLQEGYLHLSAQFDQARILGYIGGIDPYSPAQLDLEPTTIDGNGFSGEVVPGSFFGKGFSGSVSGTYTGKFYGPDAEEVGGVISLTGEEVNGLGLFSGTQD